MTYRYLSHHVITIGSWLRSSTIGGSRSGAFSSRGTILSAGKVIHHLRVEFLNGLRLRTVVGLTTTATSTATTAGSCAIGLGRSSWLRLGLGLTAKVSSQYKQVGGAANIRYTLSERLWCRNLWGASRVEDNFDL